MALITAATITSVFGLGRAIDQVLETDYQSVLAAQEMNEALHMQHIALSNLLTGDRDQANAQFEISWRKYQAAYQFGSALASDESERETFNQLGLLSRRYASRGRAILRGEVEATPSEARSTLLPMLERQSQLVRMLIDSNQNAVVEANNRAKQAAQDSAWRSILLTGLGLVVAILLAIRLIVMALHPLKQLADRAQLIGEGDLGHRLEFQRDDEIGDLAESFNTMSERLQEARQKELVRIQRAERMSDAALESLYDPVLVTDSLGRIVHLNRAAQGLFGPSPSSPRRPIVEHIGDKRIVRAIENAIQDGTICASEDDTNLVPMHVGGTDRTYRLRVSPMREDSGQLLGSVAVLEDITHLKELDRLKTEFIGVASHELRTPVTSLLLSVDLMEEEVAGPLTATQREIVHAQKNDLERLERLMRELLDITRLEAGSSPPRFELVRPADLLTSTLQGLKAEAKNKSVGLVVEPVVEGAVVRADRSQMTRVLTNLASNAIRHTAAGGMVTLRALLQGDQVTFEVQDTGEGIPPEYLSRIFERFVQVPGATQGGAGLGLAIAQTIVHAHGGKMAVDSKVGQGSVFRFSLPSASLATSGDKKV
jgi:PAS domain S-box-containing protein